jgi:hypothetical protein
MSNAKDMIPSAVTAVVPWLTALPKPQRSAGIGRDKDLRALRLATMHSPGNATVAAEEEV